MCVCMCRLFELLVCVCVDCLNCDMSQDTCAEIVVEVQNTRLGF